jgi:glycosyltransferase involved in cell wall biosynthesis
MDISFIIPAYNEQTFIARTLRSIRDNMPPQYRHEIFVVDHGSLDDTRNLARANGATVIDGKTASTISKLRNLGIDAAQGRYLVFLDADTTLSPGWAGRLADALRRLDADSKLILGSKRSIPDDASWVSRTWFVSTDREYEPTHLGGGHIIATREFVRGIGGFPEYMETGEDFEFCQIAKRNGASIISDPLLKAVHNGVPQSVREFFNREKWHGRGDFATLAVFLSSTVAVLAIGFLLTHVALVALASLGYYCAALAAVGLIAMLCLASAWSKLRARTPGRLVAGTALFYLYYWARAIAGIQVAFSPRIKKVDRTSR